MLSDEQKKIVLESEWIINSILKRLGINGNEDYKQEASLYMCKCIERFDNSFETKWTTFAYKNIYLYMKRFKKAEFRVKSRLNNDFIVGRVSEPNWDYIDLKMICSDDAQKLLDLKLAGYTNAEAQKIMKCGDKKIGKLRKEIKDKYERTNNL